jgi:hypothetical protein
MIYVGDDPAVEAFLTLARRYCETVETREPDDPVSFLRNVQPLLAGLCHAALLLPGLDEIDLPNGGEGLDTRDDAHGLIDRWRPLMQGLIDDLGADADYWEMFDPYELAHPLQGSLADDLADVFIDLDEGLRRWDGADFALRRAIVWEWRFSYENHWGRHATSALRAIHALLYLHRIGDADGEEDG